MMRRLLCTLVFALLPVSVSAQIQPAWPGVTAPIFGNPSAVDGSGKVNSAQLLLPDGSAGAPSLSFASETNLGLYKSSTGVIAVGNNNITGGIPYALAPTQMRLGQAVSFGWSSADSALTAADVVLSRLAADVIAVASGDAYGLDTKAFIRTDPTIASGFGTNPSIVVANGTAAFTVNVGTGGTASAGVLTMPAATTGWACQVENVTGVAANRANQRTVQTATTTTSVTVQNQTVSTGAALVWTASDILRLLCTGY